MQGPQEKAILQNCYRYRQPIPQAIQNAPELYLGLDLYFRAFLDLTSCRSVGFGQGPIPWTAMDQWARRHRLNAEQWEDLDYFIGEMDKAYLKHHSKKAKRTAKGKKRRPSAEEDEETE